MTGVEVAVVAMAGWLWRRARHAGSAVTEQVDESSDLAVQKLFGVVKAKLGDDPALLRLETEAVAGVGGVEVSERTVRRVSDAVADAVEDDAAFGLAVQAFLDTVTGETVSQVQVNAPRDRAVVNAPMRGNVNVLGAAVPPSDE